MTVEIENLVFSGVISDIFGLNVKIKYGIGSHEHLCSAGICVFVQEICSQRRYLCQK